MSGWMDGLTFEQTTLATTINPQTEGDRENNYHSGSDNVIDNMLKILRSLQIYLLISHILCFCSPEKPISLFCYRKMEFYIVLITSLYLY